jgi:hypothetical protein
MLNTGRGSESILPPRGPDFFLRRRFRMQTAMTQSERIRLLQEAANKYVSRNKCVDSSLQTLITQSKASSTYAPQTVAGRSGWGSGTSSFSVVATGKGTNGEYINILQAAQANAIGAPCSNTPADTGVTTQIVLPTPCVDFNAPPFTQQNMSSFYTAPCVNPGKRDYFPALQSNGPGCTTTINTTPS